MKDFHYFVSYSRDIYAVIVEQLVQNVESYGIKLWLDKTEVTLGTEIYNNINSVLEKTIDSYGAILIIDESYLKKSWCNYEMEFFSRSNIKCLPILYKMDKDDLPYKYRWIKNFNIATIKSPDDISITVDKILMVFADQVPIVEKCFYCPWEILKNLIVYLRQSNFFSPNYIFICENICHVLENANAAYKNEKNATFPLFKIIHAKTNKLYTGRSLSYYEYKLVFKAIHHIIKEVNIDD